MISSIAAGLRSKAGIGGATIAPSSAGAVEAIFSLLAIHAGRLPPTINYDLPDPDIPLDVVPNKARDVPVTTVLCNSFGFGGQNVALVLGSP